MQWLSQLPRVTVGRPEPNLIQSNGITPVSNLICTTYDADDLYGLLLRLSINDEEKPTLATRHAINALSFRQLDTTQALAWQTSAICALQSAIKAMVPSRAFQTMAASMLLSIVESLRLDAPPSNWPIFFCGTKKIAGWMAQSPRAFYGDDALILNWIFHHDAMYKFGLRHWTNNDSRNQTQLAESTEVIIPRTVVGGDRQTVVPLLGCSLELLDLLCQAVDAVLDHNDPFRHSEPHVQLIASLETRARTAEQRCETVSQESVNSTHTAKVAEIYRLALLIYLARVSRDTPHESRDVQEPLRASFALLEEMKFCDRPWPLFIIGLEARTEEDRRLVLAVVDESLRRRPMSGLALTSRMLRDAWVQTDLWEGNIDALMLYNLVMSRTHVPPCFA